MRFLVDAQLPPALAAWPREAGHKAEAARDIGLLKADDSEIWQYALETGAVTITKDEDFSVRAQSPAHGPAIVWLRTGNTSNRVLRDKFMPRLDEVIALLVTGAMLVELN